MILAALALLRSQANALVFLAGFVVFYIGIAGFSRSAANIVAGALLMGTAAWPYLSRVKRTR